jgi:aryl-alcohol dehydrogenase-like predicted oxidoreductase
MADVDFHTGAIPLRPLGRTGVKVSALGLGGHHLGYLKRGPCAAAAPQSPAPAAWSCTSPR